MRSCQGTLPRTWAIPPEGTRIPESTLTVVDLLARSVGPNVADQLSLLDLKRDAIEGTHLAVAPVNQASQRSPGARLTLSNAVDLGECLYGDQRHVRLPGVLEGGSAA